jgi:hypothetical protein
MGSLDLYKFDKGGKTYYFYLGKRTCDFCDNEIIDPNGILEVSFNKISFFEVGGVKKRLNNPKYNKITKLYHFGCISKVSNKLKGDKFQDFHVIFAYEVPGGSIPVLINNINLREGGNVSVFDAVELPSDSVKDRTVHAGRDSLEGASVGLVDSSRLDELDSSVKDIDGFLASVNDSTPVIAEDKKKLLGGKE